MNYTVYIPIDYRTQNAVLIDERNKVIFTWDIEKLQPYWIHQTIMRKFELNQSSFVERIRPEALTKWNKGPIFDTIEDFKLWFAEEYLEHIL